MKVKYIQNQSASYYLMLIAASAMFSNVWGEDGQLNGLKFYNYVSILSLAFVIFIYDLRSYLTAIGLVFFIMLSLGFGINAPLGNDFGSMIIPAVKIFILVGLYRALKIINVDKVFKLFFWVWTTSVVFSVVLIILGQDDFRYILYPGSPPRFAALSIEPAGFALATLSLYAIFLRSNYRILKRNKILFYIPFVLAQSSAIILKIILDFFSPKKRAITALLSSAIALTLIFLVFVNTRVAESIIVRLHLFEKSLQEMNLNFFGYGYSDPNFISFPGLVKFPIELGLSMFLLYITLSAYIIINSDRKFFSFFCSIIPMITETYGAIFFWAPLLMELKIIHDRKGSHQLKKYRQMGMINNEKK
jgi:hypothetical protein